MKAFLFLVLFIPHAFGQEVCPDDMSTYNLAEDLNNQVQDSLNWASCKVFNIDDKSVLKTPKKIDRRVLLYYKQKELTLNDPIADYAITRGNIKSFKNIIRRLIKKPKSENPEMMDHAMNCAKVLFDLEEPEEPEYSESGKYVDSERFKEDAALLEELLADYSPEEKKKIMELFRQGKFSVEPKSSPISPNKMSIELIDVIKEEEAKGLKITEGDKHRWSPEYKKTIGLNIGKQVFSIPSRILSTLGPGKSSAVMVTGKENELRSFILEQPDRSLTPNELFRRSLQINGGNVYLSLLTIENILSEYWRNGNREQLKQTTKLKPLGKVFGSNGDVYGTWYHMFGIMFYGYVEGKTASTLVGKTESTGSQILSNFEEEYQENQINKNGGKVGANLKNYLRAKDAGKPYNFKPEEKIVDVDQELKERVKERIAATLKANPVPVEPERMIAEEKKEEEEKAME